MPTLLDQLSGGDLRTLGRSAEVAAQVLARPELIDERFDGLASDDEVITGRADERPEAAALVEECATRGDTPALRARARQMRKLLGRRSVGWNLTSGQVD